MITVIIDLVRITQKPRDEIIDFVQSNLMSYEDLRYFYLALARFPTSDECKVIYKYGVGIYTSLATLKTK